MHIMHLSSVYNRQVHILRRFRNCNIVRKKLFVYSVLNTCIEFAICRETVSFSNYTIKLFVRYF